jgi:TPR repeat protein
MEILSHKAFMAFMSKRKITKCIRIVFTVTFLFCTTCVGADDIGPPTLETAKQYLHGEKGDSDYGRAYSILMMLSKNNNTEAIILLGAMYGYGDHVKKSAYKVYTYFKKAAELGSPLGKTLLAGCYMRGLGVDRDTDEAFDLLEEASGLGGHWADFLLAIIYDKGYRNSDLELAGINKEKAIKYFKKAANEGNATAYYSLGRIAVSSKERDIDKAIEYYYKAADMGDPNAQFEIGYSLYTGKVLEKDRDKGLSYLKKAAYSGVIDAVFVYGLSFLNKNNQKTDPVRTYAWLSMVDKTFRLEEDRPVAAKASKILRALDKEMSEDEKKRAINLSAELERKIFINSKYKEFTIVRNVLRFTKFDRYRNSRMW